MGLVAWIFVGLAVTGGAQPGPAIAKIIVEITHPEPGEAIFGQVEIAAAVLSPNPVDRVELWIDGVRAATVRQRPYRFLVDVGSENRERHIAVVAYDRQGNRRRAEMVTARGHRPRRPAGAGSRPGRAQLAR